MLKLQGITTSRWDAPPFIVRLTSNDRLPVPLRHSEALIGNLSTSTDLDGFKCFFKTEEANPFEEGSSLPSAPIVKLPTALGHLKDGDILKISPRTGRIRVLYRKESNSNIIFTTERCNSFCLMCSQPPQEIDDYYLIDDYLKAIPLMSKDTLEIGITGGEPTLLKEKLLDIVRTCRNQLPNTALHILSNGRLFAYLNFARAISAINHPDLMIGIPLYSDVSSSHDYVVQAKGAFDQTIRGVLNLARTNTRIEIRVVIHQETYQRLPHLATFISRNLPFVSHIAFMGLEFIGHTRINFDQLWVNPQEYQEQLETAVNFLLRKRLNVSIYNHQLCLIKPSLWPVARKSISDWKNEYLPQCEECVVKEKCGGFFSSVIQQYKDSIHPIQTP
jgi:His-Xaa-Ser system radical SAM maturase HxsC